MCESLKYFAIWYMVFFLVFLGRIQVCEGKGSGGINSYYDLGDTEINAGNHVATWIEAYSDDAGYDELYFYASTEVTRNNIYYVAMGDLETYAIAWYHGHGGFDYWVHLYPYPHLHTNMVICTYTGELVSDADIHPKTSNRDVRFTFMYTCKCGSWIGGYYVCGQPFGMPHAWLHTTDLSSNGYTNPDGDGYTFIGWAGLGPQLRVTVDGVPFAGRDFCVSFYKAALHLGGYSIIESLDYAAYETFEDPTFGDCIFYTGVPMYGHMVVYGDGNLDIS